MKAAALQKAKWLTALAVSFLAAQAASGQSQSLETERAKTSYAIGVDLARNFKRQGIECDNDALLQGMRDVLSKEKLRLSEEEFHAAINRFQVEMKQKRARPALFVAENNKKASDTFLAANKTKAGVITLPSGVQYKILKEGTGKKPTSSDVVECHYRGTLIDGTEFDTSYGRGQPSTFKIAGVIEGWKEALPKMPVGSRWQLFIPSQLAYGEQGHAPLIGPNSALIFEVELIGIK